MTRKKGTHIKKKKKKKKKKKEGALPKFDLSAKIIHQSGKR
jgi:hypothetical protein